MDVFIARVCFPNDPSHTLVAHQMFIGQYISESYVEFYSISSVLGKERRVFAEDGSVNVEIALIVEENQRENGFRVPSFIDCSKSYTVFLSDSVDLEKLNHRDISSKLHMEIVSKINSLKKAGRHTNYSISLNDFIRWNQRIVNEE